MEFIKKDDTTLEVVKPVETKEQTTEYNVDFLKGQEITLIKQKNDFIEARDLEIAEVRVLLAKCEELGIKTVEEKELEEVTEKEAELTK